LLELPKLAMCPQQELLSLVDNLMKTTATQSQLFSFMCRLNNLDDVTFNHSLNVSILAHIFGIWLHLDPTELEELTLAGLLHDIGKLKVNADILNKPAKLTDEEFTQIKKHTVLGYEMIAATDLPDSVKHTILMHHEKMNGAGYPLGLSWNNIHPYAKIVSIVDIYDAMTAERPYHKRFHPFHVIKMFEEECYGVLDTHYLYIFLEHIAHNFLHDKVILSNNDQANIIFINKQSPSRPIVETLHKNIIDLYTNPKIEIEGFI
jgi:putative nucleotidyltransferase with HDIG domain